MTLRTNVIAWLIITLILLGSLYSISTSYVETSQQNVATQQNLSRTLLHHATESLRSTLTALDAIEHEITEENPGPENLQSLMVSTMHHLRGVVLVSFIDAEGNLVAAHDGKNHSNINLSQREYFQYLKKNPDVEWTFDGTLTDKIYGHDVVVMARRVDDDQHRFLGVLVAGLSSSFFQNIYDSVTDSNDTTITLLRVSDEKIMIHSPKRESIRGTTRYQRGEWIDEYQISYSTQIRANENGYSLFRDQSNGQLSIVAWSIDNELGVAVNVTKSQFGIYISWFKQAILELTSAIFLILLVFFFKKSIDIQQANLKKANQKLDSRNQLLGAVFDSAQVGVLLTNRSGRLVKVNKTFASLFGYRVEDLLGRHFDIVLQQEDKELRRKIHDEFMNGLIDHDNGELTTITQDGKKINVFFANTLIRGHDGESLKLTTIQDLTPIRQQEERISHLALHDQLTDLPNRFSFNERLQSSIDHCRDGKGQVTLIYMDLDRFKEINDTLGHSFGDRVLMEVATRLRKSIKKDDFVARMGGDEFAIIMDGVLGSANCHDQGCFSPGCNLLDECRINRLCSRIIEIVSRPVLIEGRELHVGVSLGIAKFPNNASNVEDLKKNADLALYRSKDLGRNRFTHYDPTLGEHIVQTQHIMSDVRAGLHNQEFEVWYQPIFDIDQNRMIGKEALVRWRRADGEIWAPGRFINVIENEPLIDELTWVIVEQACRQHSILLANGTMHHTLNVNVAPRTYLSHDFVPKIKSVVKVSNLPPDTLFLEITEGTLVESFERTRDVMTALNELGVRTVIDDFGTGYSSLAYLHKLPFNRIKIDRSFVKDIEHNNQAHSLVEGILRIGQSLGREVVAEGVETSGQLNALLNIGCIFAQGYLWAKPMAANEFEKFLESCQKGVDAQSDGI